MCHLWTLALYDNAVEIIRASIVLVYQIMYNNVGLNMCLRMYVHMSVNL